MTIRQFIKKLFVTIIMIGIVLAAVLKVGYILICKVIVVIIFVVLAIQYWVGEDIRKAEEEKRGTWLFTLGFIGLTVLTMLAANIPGQVQRDQYLYLTKEHTEQLEKVLLREATADSERCIQWYEKQMLGIRNNKALGNPAMQTEDERRYKNRIDGKEVYRDPDTCTLRVKELKDGSTKDSVLINGPVGEIIAMRERIFYIDMEDHNVLKSVTYDGRKRKTWTKDPVKQFAVIGEKYLTFDPGKAHYPKAWRKISVDETDMLMDLLDSGIYGNANMSRKHSSNMTLDAVAADKNGKKAGNTVLKSLFPSAKKLEGRYPYLKKHPILLPIAWTDRILKYRKETVAGGDNAAADSVKIGNQRIELMKEYGIIKNDIKR